MFKNLNLGALGLKASFFEAVEQAKTGGFQGLDIDVSEMEEILKKKKAGDIKALMDSKGLRLGGWGLPVNFRRDDDTFQKDLERLNALAKTARIVGCFRAYTWLTPFSDILSYEENFKLHAERLGAVAEVLAEHDCVLGLEFVGPKTSRISHKYEFIHTMDGIFELREAMKAENVGLLLDCWHWHTSHGTVDQLQKLRKEDVVYVHVNDAPSGVPVDEQIDWKRQLPGESGVINITGFLKALKHIGYAGPVTPEPFEENLKKLPVGEAVLKVSKALDKVWRQAGI